MVADAQVRLLRQKMIEGKTLEGQRGRGDERSDGTQLEEGTAAVEDQAASRLAHAQPKLAATSAIVRCPRVSTARSTSALNSSVYLCASSSSSSDSAWELSSP